jgi:hypothetical protein
MSTSTRILLVKFCGAFVTTTRVPVVSVENTPLHVESFRLPSGGRLNSLVLPDSHAYICLYRLLPQKSIHLLPRALSWLTWRRFTIDNSGSSISFEHTSFHHRPVCEHSGGRLSSLALPDSHAYFGLRYRLPQKGIHLPPRALSWLTRRRFTIDNSGASVSFEHTSFHHRHVREHSRGRLSSLALPDSHAYLCLKGRLSQNSFRLPRGVCTW